MYTYHVKEMFFVSSCTRTAFKVTIYLLLFLISLLVILIPQLVTMNQPAYHRPARYATDLKYILFWNRPKHHKNRFNRTLEFTSGQSMFIEQSCPYINCYITFDRKFLRNDKDYDAIVFDIDDVIRMNVDQLNMTRSVEQIYIFRATEPPEKHPVCNQDFEDFFNWTWTYKLNSDIPQPFFKIYDENNTIVGPKLGMKWVEKMQHVKHDSKIQHKIKAVAWILNKCKLKTKYQDFIVEFRKELKGYNYSLDIYGSCGHKCHENNFTKCHKRVEKNYFFQLVVEEFMSEDYLSDNMVTALAQFTIPIVYGSADYRNFLPPGGYINAQAFDMKKLGAIIDYLIKNPDMYEYFFDWKNHYHYKRNPRTQVCNLCRKLNEKNITVQYNNFRHWWEPDFKDICQRLLLYTMFNENN